jgi:hypothetical protein
VKDIVLWQTAAARKREERNLRKLAALHQSVVPPSELLLPTPRKLHWKRSLKFMVAFDVVLLVFMICMGVRLSMVETQFYTHIVKVMRLGREKMQNKAAQTTDPERKAKIERVIRESESFDRKWLILHIVFLAAIWTMLFVLPVAHETLNWFIHVRTDLILLRRGIPVRATVSSGALDCVQCDVNHVDNAQGIRVFRPHC